MSTLTSHDLQTQVTPERPAVRRRVAAAATTTGTGTATGSSKRLWEIGMVSGAVVFAVAVSAWVNCFGV